MAASARASREERRAKVSGRKRAEEHKSGFQSKCFNVPADRRLFMIKAEDVKRIDILSYEVPEGSKNPYGEVGELHFELTYYAHRDVGPEGDMYPCLKKTFGRACPICDYRAGLLKDPDADEKLVKDLAPRERQLWNIFDHDEPDKGVQLWEFSFHLFGKQLDARVNNSDEEDGYEFFADPDEGLTLKVGFQEKTFGGNTFFECTTIDFKARREPLSDELISQAMVLDKLLIPYEYEYLKSVFLATAAPSGKDEDEIRQPKEAATPRRRPKAEDEEPAKEEAPVRRRRPEPEAAEVKKEEAPRRRPKPETEAVKEEPAKRVGKSESVKSAESPAKKTTATTETASRSDKKASPTAKEFGIEVNMIVDHDEYGECSVVKISSDGTAVYVLDSKDVKHSVGPEECKNPGFPEEEPVKEEPKAKSGKAATGKAAKKEEPAEEEAAEGDEEEWDTDWEEEDDK